MKNPKLCIFENGEKSMRQIPQEHTCYHPYATNHGTLHHKSIHALLEQSTLFKKIYGQGIMRRKPHKCNNIDCVTKYKQVHV
jgi:hypothetical protein